jgi:adhesin transport system membrane fusion protein
MSARPAPRAPAAPARWSEAELYPESGGTRWQSHGLLLGTVVFFALAFAWASYATLDEVARGEGKVVTWSQVQLVQNLEGGIVSEILVKEGEQVKKGQTLMRFDSTRFAAPLAEGRQSAAALRMKAARLESEQSGRPFALAEALARENPGLAANERSLFQARRHEFGAKLEVLRQQLAQRQQELAELRARQAKLKESLALAQKEHALTAPLAQKGVVSEVELLRLEREVSRIGLELEATTLSLPRVEAAIAEAGRRIEDHHAAYQSAVAAELTQARAELAKVSETIPALADRVTRTELKAPVDGIVKRVKVTTIGGVVQPGSDVLEIVPAQETLLVEARIRPEDIAFVHVGQRAVVKVTAYDYSIYGGLEGKLEHVSADSIETDKGFAFYLVRVRTDRAHLERGGKRLPVIPGMTATVDVLTGKRTVLEYLLKPINKARERALTER